MARRRPDPTVPPPQPASLGSALERNIEALADKRRREWGAAGAEDRLAEAITRFAGSLRFVYVHLLLVGAWVTLNVGLVPGIAPFDPTFVILATVASVEAIFLSTFVLISQNRAAQAADRRADLDLQISLLAEHEITKLVQLTARIADKVGVDSAQDPEMQEIQRDVAPEAVMDRIERSKPEG